MLFNIFLEVIMRDILEHHHTSMSVGGRPLINHRFTDDLVTRPEDKFTSSENERIIDTEIRK